MKTLNNIGWMLLGVAVGSGGLFCYKEYMCDDSKIKDSVSKLKKNASEKLENMMQK